MPTYVVFQMSLGCKLLRASGKIALVGLLTRMYSLVGLEISFFGERLGAVGVGTFEGTFPSLGMT